MGNVNDYSALITNLFLAIIPSIILCIFVYKMDVVEKEPTSMLLRLFFLGVLCTAPAAYLEKTIINFTDISADDYINSFILAFLIIAVVEEGYKYLILALGTWRNRNFDHKYDAIVYAVFISLGFATLENILYVHENGSEVAALRAIISVPAHAFYAVASGYFFGHAKQFAHDGNKSKEILNIFLSIIAPIILHGTFDYLLFLENNVILGIFFGFVALLYMVSYCSIKKVSATKMIKDNIDTEQVKEEQNEESI